MAFGALLSDCLCGLKCESNQDADKSAETVCIYWLGKMLEILSVDRERSIELYSLSDFILQRRFIAQLLIHETSCAFDYK